MEYLAKKARDSKIERFQPKGDTFHAIEVDGQYFYGVISCDTPCIVRRTSRLRGYEKGWVQIGVSKILFTSGSVSNNDRPKSWSICKYSKHEARVPLDDLSPAGRHAVAHEFGISIYDPVHESNEPVQDDAMYWVGSDATLFYHSPAFHSLCEIAKMHPRKARRWQGSSYLGDWGEMARGGTDKGR